MNEGQIKIELKCGTEARMITLRKGKPITCSSEYLKLIVSGMKETSALLICTPSTGTFRIKPLPSDFVLKVIIYYYGDKNPEIVQDLVDIYNQEKVIVLYSHVLCLTKDPDFYEGFIAMSSLSPIAVLKERLEGIKGVEEVEITRITDKSVTFLRDF